MSIWDDLKNAALSSLADLIPGSAAPGLPTPGSAAVNTAAKAGAFNPASGITGFMGSIEVFLTALEDGQMWRSLGWLLLGTVLIITGLIIMLRHPLAELGGAAVKGAMV